MDHPDEPVAWSRSMSGDVAEKPDQIIAVVVSDEDNEPTGILEKWNAETWIYADADSLEPIN